MQLGALMWLVGDTLSIEEWEDAWQEAGNSLTKNTADYLIYTPLLAN